MSITTAEKAHIVKEFGHAEQDTGASEVQIALLTKRIIALTEHVKQHTHDHHTRRGLVKSVSQRRKLLKYLKRTAVDRYRDVLKRLKLRDSY